MRSELIKILNDELSTRSQSTSQKWVRWCNKDIMCAVRLMNVLMINDFEMTMKLADFIRNSWTDLEPTDAQKKSILDEIVRLRLEYQQRQFDL